MTKGPLVSVKIRLLHAEGFPMGPGKADLLEAIQDTQAIAGAGRKLGLSYWKTRRLLDEMNRCFKAPVVLAAKGGDKGGGACLTATGAQALAMYRTMEIQAAQAIAVTVQAYQELLADPK